MEYKGLALALVVGVIIAIAGPVWAISLGFMEIPVVAVVVAFFILLVTQAYSTGEKEEIEEDDGLDIEEEIEI